MTHFWLRHGIVLSLGLVALTYGHGQNPPTKDGKAWKSLFDGKTLTNWKSTNFGGEADVEVKDGAIIMEQGSDMTGVTYSGKDFPKLDYEFTLEGKRVKGGDFFCTTTFPV